MYEAHNLFPCIAHYMGRMSHCLPVLISRSDSTENLALILFRCLLKNCIYTVLYGAQRDIDGSTYNPEINHMALELSCWPSKEKQCIEGESSCKVGLCFWKHKVDDMAEIFIWKYQLKIDRRFYDFNYMYHA